MQKLYLLFLVFLFVSFSQAQISMKGHLQQFLEPERYDFGLVNPRGCGISNDGNFFSYYEYLGSNGGNKRGVLLPIVKPKTKMVIIYESRGVYDRYEERWGYFGRQCRYKLFYDTTGNISDLISYHGDTIGEAYKFVFENGKLIEIKKHREKVAYPDNSDFYENHIHIKYDSHGNVAKIFLRLYNGRSPDEVRLKWSSTGFLVQSQEFLYGRPYKREGDFFSFDHPDLYIYQYSQNGKNIIIKNDLNAREEIITKDGHGVIQRYKHYEDYYYYENYYDVNKNLSRQTEYRFSNGEKYYTHGSKFEYEYHFYLGEEEKKKYAEEKKYNEYINCYNVAYEKNDLAVAKQALENALSLNIVKPETQSKLSELINNIDQEIKIDSLVSRGDVLFLQNKFDQARECYTIALTIEPNKQITNIRQKIAETDTMLHFCEERLIKWYDYRNINPISYDSISNSIINKLKTYMFSQKKKLSQTKIEFNFMIDTLEKVSYVVEPDVKDKVSTVLKTIAKEEQNYFYPCEMKGFLVNTYANFSFDIMYNKKTLAINKEDYRKKDYIRNRFIKNDGAGNVLLSILIPGLGDHRVSHGKRKGIGITLSTCGLIGAGVGLKLFSNNEYKKYLAVTTQNEMDKYYKTANVTNKLFYGSVIVAGCIWLSDIIWVACKGKQNKKQKLNGSFALNMDYQPNFKIIGLGMSFKI